MPQLQLVPGLVWITCSIASAFPLLGGRGTPRPVLYSVIKLWVWCYIIGLGPVSGDSACPVLEYVRVDTTSVVAEVCGRGTVCCPTFPLFALHLLPHRLPPCPYPDAQLVTHHGIE